MAKSKGSDAKMIKVLALILVAIVFALSALSYAFLTIFVHRTPITIRETITYFILFIPSLVFRGWAWLLEQQI